MTAEARRIASDRAGYLGGLGGDGAAVAPLAAIWRQLAEPSPEVAAIRKALADAPTAPKT